MPIPNEQLPSGFTVRQGWSDELARQLVEQSKNDPAITRFTPRDSTERFSTLDTATSWYERKSPTIYSLSQAAELAGVIWYSQNPRDDLDADYTFAIRMYTLARGKGLAASFMELCENDFRNTVQPNGVWLETDSDNTPAKSLYQKLGYTVTHTTDSRITMRK